jgi:hypothetical protein
VEGAERRKAEGREEALRIVVEVIAALAAVAAEGVVPVGRLPLLRVACDWVDKRVSPAQAAAVFAREGLQAPSQRCAHSMRAKYSLQYALVDDCAPWALS